MWRRGGPGRLRAGGEDPLEEAEAHGDNRRDEHDHRAERDVERRRPKIVAIRDRQDQRPENEPEHGASRERRQLDYETEGEEHGERGAQAMPRFQPEIDRGQDEERDQEPIPRWFGSPVRPFGRKMLFPLTAPKMLIEVSRR